jgi:phospholipid/cholesterol/gamma-HCH transport system substrate-binding protein
VKRRREFIVGVTVVTAVLAVAVGALWLSQTSLARDQIVKSARFREVGGLKPGAPVTLRGVKVGRVTAIRLAADEWVQVDMQFERTADLPPDPAVVAASSSLFGEWRANILGLAEQQDDPELSAALEQARAPGGEAWPGATLPDIGELTQQASRIAGDVANVTKRLEGVLDSNAVKELKASIQDLSQISRRLAGFARSQTQRLDTVGENISLGSSAFVRTVTRLDSATSGGIVPEVAGNTRMALADLRKAAADLREVTEAAAQNKVSMVQALQSADSILRRIERGQGTLGMLASDTMLYREATLTFQEARALIADIRNNPKKYLKVSVF